MKRIALFFASFFVISNITSKGKILISYDANEPLSTSVVTADRTVLFRETLTKGSRIETPEMAELNGNVTIYMRSK